MNDNGPAGTPPIATGINQNDLSSNASALRIRIHCTLPVTTLVEHGGSCGIWSPAGALASGSLPHSFTPSKKLKHVNQTTSPTPPTLHT